jgi:predicted ATPase
MLKSLTIRNFKSLKQCKVPIEHFNLLVGPNASGKSNLLDLFKLLRKIYIAREISPFLDWWGYDNVVWNRDESLQISVKLDFVAEGPPYSFETVVTGIGGRFQILREELHVQGVFKFIKEGEQLTVIHDRDFLSGRWTIINNALSSIFAKSGVLSRMSMVPSEASHLEKQTIQVSLWSLLGLRSAWFIFDSAKAEDVVVSCGIIPSPEREAGKGFNPLIFVCPRPTGRGLEHWPLPAAAPPLMQYLSAVHEFLKRAVILRNINLPRIKEPARPQRETELEDDAANLINVAYNLLLRENRLPEKISAILSYFFPELPVKFELAQDGRVLIKGGQFYPPGLPDGFFKTLAILVALESKPPLLAIDEFENSLHPQLAETLIDELKGSGTQVIVVTHSPTVVDAADPEDLILASRDDEGTSFRRVKEPQQIRQWLREKGLTLSEKWLYAEI